MTRTGGARTPPPAPRTGGGALGRFPAPALFLVSGLAQYGGAVIAVGLFAVVPAASVAWLRIAVAAVVLLAWRRPWRSRWSRADLGAAALFGVVLAAMNVAFYIAIAALPLGTAVAIEFLGPVAVAAITGHGWRERLGIVVAGAGVVLLAGVQLEAGDGPEVTHGLIAIGVAAACWAGYILLGRRVATGGKPTSAVEDRRARPDGIASLSVGMSVGALVFAVVLGRDAQPVVHDVWLLVRVVGVAVLSSVVPYVIEQVVLRRITAAAFSVLLAMLPATAAVVGAVALQQWPHGWEIVGLLLVSGAIVLTATDRRPAPDATP